MKPGRHVIGSVKPALTVLLLLAGFLLHAEHGVTVIPVPGSYATDQLLSIRTPPDSRLTVYLDGKRLDDIASPLLLYAEYGEQRSYRIQTELRSLDPDSPLLESRVFEWIIDKKQPASPRFVLNRVDGGAQARIRSDEPAVMHYVLYHPYYQAVSRGSVSDRDSVFIPEDTVICAFAEDRAGNRSLPSSATAENGVHAGKPFVMVNPVPGSWANRQTLLLDTRPETEIRYTTDGSDPLVSGKTYNGPVLLDESGPVTLRVSARGADGTPWTETVLYTVAEQASVLDQSISLTDGVFEAGPFYEATLPEGFTATIGNPWNSGQPRQSLLFTVPEGVRRMYPVTVRSGAVFWRWICAVGTPPSALPSEKTDGENPLQPKVSIHDWHFFSVSHSAPVFYSHDGSSWTQYTEPVVLDRKKDAVIHWYSPSWDGGKVRTISLPAKPQLSGLPAGGVTANPVFLSASASPFTLYYSTGGDFLPGPPVYEHSPVLASGLLLETPHGASEPCTVRLAAYHDGIMHGELTARFTLDRKPPRVPSLGIPADLSWSREPLPLRVSGEDMVQVSLVPEQYEHTGSAWVLTGNPEKSITYTIRSFSVDRAGNRSPIVEQTMTIDRNAVYVDSGYRGTLPSDGSPSAPFTDLDSALDLVEGPDPWRILVRGSVALERPHTLRSSVSLIGTKAVLQAGPAAVLRSYSNNLSLSGITLERNGRVIDRTQQVSPVPLMEVANGTLSIDECAILDRTATNAPVIRVENSHATFKSVKIHTESVDYGTAVDVRNSNFHVRDCHIESSARIVSAVAVTGGRATFINSDIVVSAERAARAIECWGSRLVISGLRLVRSGATGTNADTALWTDRNTVIVSEKAFDVTGFRYRKKSGER